MTLSRRGFLGAMLAACAAPAIVKASSLMKVVTVSGIPPIGMEATESGILVPEAPRLFQGEIGTIDGFSFVEPADASDIVYYHWDLVDTNGRNIKSGYTRETTITVKDVPPGGTYNVRLTVRAENVGSISRVNPNQELKSDTIFLHSSTLGHLQSTPEDKRKSRERPGRKSVPLKYGPANRRKYG